MNEEALQHAYGLMTADGYNGSIEEYSNLIATNPEAKTYSYGLFQKDGFNGDETAFSNLVTLDAAPVEEKKNLDAIDTELPLEDGSLDSQETNELPFFDAFGKRVEFDTDGLLISDAPESDNPSVGEDMWNSLKAGTKATLSQISAIPNQITKSVFSLIAPQELEDYINTLEPKDRETFMNNMLMANGSTSAATSFGALGKAGGEVKGELNKEAEEIRKKMTQYDESITEDLGNLEFAQAGKRIAVEGVGVIPSVIQAMIPYVGLASVGLGSAAAKQDQLEAAGADFGGATIINSTLTGAVEGLLEKYTAKQGGKLLKALKGQSETVIRKGVKGFFDGLGEVGLGMFKEGGSEALTALGTNLVDAITTGNDKEAFDIFTEITDQFLIGAAVGAPMKGGEIVIQNIAEGAKQRKQNRDAEFEIIGEDGQVELNIPATEMADGTPIPEGEQLPNQQPADNQGVVTPENGVESTEQDNVPNTEATEQFDGEIPNAEPMAQDIGAEEVQANGFGLTSNPKRDSSLGEGGAVDTPKADKFRQKFKRVVQQTFSSEAGLDQEVIRVSEKHQGRVGLLSKVLELDQKAFGGIIKSAKKSLGKKNLNTGLKSINEYLSGDSTQDLSFLPAEQKQQLDEMRDKLDNRSSELVDRLKEQRGRLMVEMEGEMVSIEKMQTAQVAADNPLGLDFEIEHQHRSANMTGLNNKAGAVDALIATIEGNMGKYLFRSYDAFSDPDYVKTLTSKTPNKEGQRRFNNAVEFVMQELSVDKATAESQIGTYLDGIQNKESYLAARMDGKIEAPFLKKRKDIPEPIRELLGESKDPVKNYIASSHNIGQYLSSIQYQTELSKFLIDSGIGKPKWERGHTLFKTNNQGWDFLEETYVPTEFAESMEDIKGLDPLNGGWSQAMVNIAGWSKLGKTVLSPTTAFRNLWSGSFLSLNAGFNPFNIKMFEGIQQSWGTNATKTGRLAKENAILLELGIIGDGVVSGEILQIMNDMKIDSKTLTNKSFKQKSMEFMQKFYAMGDDAYKVVGFYAYTNSYQKTGMNLEQAQEAAAQRIRNGFPTYSKLPKNIQKLRRFPLVGTFPSFAYEVWRTNKNNLQFIAKDLESAREATDPATKKAYRKMAFDQMAGMTAASVAAVGLNTLSKGMFDISDEEEETAKNMSPEWQQDMMPIFYSKGDGNLGYVDSSAFFPQEVILKPIRILMEEREGRDINDKLSLALKEGTSAFLGTDILVGTMSDLHSNKSSYGQEIYKADNLIEGVFSEDFSKISDYFMANAGYGYYNNIKEFARANADKEWMPEPFIEHFGEKSSKYKEYTNEEVFLGFMGFRLSNVDFAQGMSNLALNAREDFMRKRSEALRAVKVPRTRSQADIQDIVQSEDDFNKEVHEKSLLAVSGAYNAKIPPKRLEQVLKAKNFSDKSIVAIMNGVEPPLKQVRKSDLKKYLTEIEVGRLRTDESKEYTDLTNDEKTKFDKRVKITTSMIENTLEFNKQTAKKNMENMGNWMFNTFGDKLKSDESVKTLTADEAQILKQLKNQGMFKETANDEFGNGASTSFNAYDFYRKLLE